MSPRRVVTLLGAALAIGLLAVWLAAGGSRGANGPAAAAVFPELRAALNDITTVRLLRGDGTRTTLRRSGQGWQVVEREYPADIARLRALLLDLAELRVVEEKTADPDRYAQLGVEEVSSPEAAGTRLEIEAPGRSFALIAGRTAGADSSYVRPAGMPASLLVSPRIAVEADPARWIDRTLLEVPRERVQSVSLVPAEGPPYAIRRTAAGEPQFTLEPLPAGRALASPGAAGALAGAFADLTFDDVQAASGDAPERPRLILRTTDGLEVTLQGRTAGERHYVRASARAYEAGGEAEAARLNARLAGRELALPAYRHEMLFRPLEALLAPK